MDKLAVPAMLTLLVGCQTPANTYKQEVRQSLASLPQEVEEAVITEQQIGHLPPPVQRYLRYAGVVGKPPIRVVRLRQSGLFKTSRDSDFKKMVAEEYYFPKERAFFWLGDVHFVPLIHFYARDKYANGTGNVWVKLANLFTVANGRGKEFDISCLVRYFNEIVWFPSAFLDGAIAWQAVDDLTATATLTDRGMTASATFHFNAMGEMVLFESNDRYAMIDGKMEKAPWRTPMRAYKEFAGYKVPTKGEAIYRFSSGDFEYGRIKIENVEMNRFNSDEEN